MDKKLSVFFCLFCMCFSVSMAGRQESTHFLRLDSVVVNAVYGCRTIRLEYDTCQRVSRISKSDESVVYNYEYVSDNMISRIVVEKNGLPYYETSFCYDSKGMLSVRRDSALCADFPSYVPLYSHVYSRDDNGCLVSQCDYGHRLDNELTSHQHTLYEYDAGGVVSAVSKFKVDEADACTAGSTLSQSSVLVGKGVFDHCGRIVLYDDQQEPRTIRYQYGHDELQDSVGRNNKVGDMLVETYHDNNGNTIAVDAWRGSHHFYSYHATYALSCAATPSVRFLSEIGMIPALVYVADPVMPMVFDVNPPLCITVFNSLNQAPTTYTYYYTEEM